MLSKETISRIRQIEIKSNKLVDESFSGEYRSGFKGKGMEFEDIRQYYPGDDVRNIEWNVTARQNNAYVKQFCEERELNMFLLIDMSKSNSFGRKKELITEVGATLAFSACKNNDRVGLILFTDRIEKFIPSKSGKKHVLSTIEEIINFKPEDNGTDIAGALKFFNQIEKKRSILFLISDFFDEGYLKELKVSFTRHDLVMIRVIDRSEEVIPAGAIFTFEDLETGETLVFDNRRKAFRTDQSLLPYKNSMINLYTDEDYVKPLKKFFKKRGGR